MADWRFMPQEWDWCETRMKYTGDAEEILEYLEVPLHFCSELTIEPDDSKLLNEVYEFYVSINSIKKNPNKYLKKCNNFFCLSKKAPGMEYAYGYNKDCGDKGNIYII